MTSLILRTISRYYLPLLLLFCIFLFVRGHHEPGGGFVGGLVASTAWALYALAFLLMGVCGAFLTGDLFTCMCGSRSC
jgi:multicomponent Na+:H+ antiporter subunit B